MKIRMTTNSIRIRIRKSELKDLMDAGSIQDHITFSGETMFRYGLQVSETHEVLSASFDSKYIQVYLPRKEAEQWAQTNLVGLENQVSLPENQHLLLLVEKDFPCLDREEKDYNDTFHELSEQKESNC